MLPLWVPYLENRGLAPVVITVEYTQTTQDNHAHLQTKSEENAHIIRPTMVDEGYWYIASIRIF